MLPGSCHERLRGTGCRILPGAVHARRPGPRMLTDDAILICAHPLSWSVHEPPRSHDDTSPHAIRMRARLELPWEMSGEGRPEHLVLHAEALSARAHRCALAHDEPVGALASRRTDDARSVLSAHVRLQSGTFGRFLAFLGRHRLTPSELLVELYAEPVDGLAQPLDASGDGARWPIVSFAYTYRRADA